MTAADLLADQRADGRSGGRRPALHEDFPSERGAAMPYLLLVELPRLPIHLQYRLLDRPASRTSRARPRGSCAAGSTPRPASTIR